MNFLKALRLQPYKTENGRRTGHAPEKIYFTGGRFFSLSDPALKSKKAGRYCAARLPI
jgi:hypothetical protein